MGTLLAIVLAASAHGGAFTLTVPRGYVDIGDSDEARSTVKAGGVWLIANDPADSSKVAGVIVIEPTAAQSALELSTLKACAEFGATRAQTGHSVLRSAKLVRTPLGSGCQVELAKRGIARRVMVLPFSATRSLFVSCHLLRQKARTKFDACEVAVKSLARRHP